MVSVRVGSNDYGQKSKTSAPGCSQRLSGDEWAAEGSDDNLGMDDSYTASSDEGIIIESVDSISRDGPDCPYM